MDRVEQGQKGTRYRDEEGQGRGGTGVSREWVGACQG